MIKYCTTLLVMTFLCLFLRAADHHVYSGGSIQSAINSASDGDQIIVHNGTYNQNIQISGRSGITLTFANDGEVIIQGNGTTVDVIEIVNSSNITISNFTIKNTRKVEWSTGVYVHGTGNNIQILNNNITDIAYHTGAWSAADDPGLNNIVGVNPLMVSGDNAATPLTNVLVQGNTVSYCMTGWNESITIKANVDGFIVNNNTVHHVTNIAIDAYGLGSWPNAAQTRNGEITNNVVYNAICNYTDNGGIYVDGGKDIVIANNTVYNSLFGYTIGCENQGNVSGGATSGIKVINNIAYNNARAAIMIGTGGDDDGVQGDVINSLIAGNTFLKNSTSNQWGSEIVLQNCSNITLKNNIVSGLWQQMVTEGPGGTGINTISGYNIFYNPVGSPLISQEVNNWAAIDLATWKGQVSDNSSSFTDPLLVSASATAPDFHLQTSSPAIDGGDPSYSPVSGEVDIDGQVRVQNSRVDIGVDESGSGGGNVAVTGVSVSPATASLNISGSQQLTASIFPSNATNQTVTWNSGNTSVATVSGSGLVTAIASGSATITCTTQDGSFTDTSVITVTGGGGGLPSPWSSSDIGSVGLAGSATHSGGTFTLVGSGADIWGSNDEFHYMYQQVSGDMTITARVASLTNTDGWAKGGVMIRNSLSGNSQHAFSAVTVTNGTAFQRRVTTGGVSTHTAGTGAAAPYWVRIVRTGNTFTSYVSSNGSSWTQIGSESISMGSTVYVGLAITSHTNAASCTAAFDNVTLDTGSSTVSVTGVSVSPTSSNIVVGNTQQLSATIAPANATNQNVSWSSSNTAIATVSSSGLVTAVAAGSVIITVTTQDGSFMANTAITVSSSGGGGTITVDGNLSDWSAISTVAAGTGSAQSLKVYDDGTYLYFAISGSGLNPHYQIYLNTDNNTSTGLNHWDYTSGTSGADYYIEDGNVAAYTGDGSSWLWGNSSAVTASSATGTTVREVQVAKSALGALSSTITVAFSDLSDPAWSTISTLGFSSFVPAAPPTSIIVDGNLSDWSSIASIATGSGSAQSLKVYDDGTYLYFAISGSGLNPHYQIYLNTDNNTSTGLNHWDYTSGTSGADYYIEDGSVAAYTGDGSSWLWGTSSAVNASFSTGSTVREVQVAKSTLGSPTGTITVAFSDLTDPAWSTMSTLGFATFSTSGARLGVNSSDIGEELEKVVSVYPNPVQEVLTINLERLSQPVEISIHDLEGRTLYFKTSNHPIERIQREDITGTGMIFLKIKSKEGQSIHKLILE